MFPTKMDGIPSVCVFIEESRNLRELMFYSVRTWDHQSRGRRNEAWQVVAVMYLLVMSTMREAVPMTFVPSRRACDYCCTCPVIVYKCIGTAYEQ